MKIFLFVSSLLFVAGAAQADVIAISPGALAAGPNAISTTDCTLLASAVSITLSTGNIGAYNCNTTSSAIGMAVASTSGKNKVFSVSSEGGAITALEGRFVPGAAELQAAAAISAGVVQQAEQAQTSNGGNTEAIR